MGSGTCGLDPGTLKLGPGIWNLSHRGLVPGIRFLLPGTGALGSGFWDLGPGVIESLKPRAHGAIDVPVSWGQ